MKKNDMRDANKYMKMGWVELGKEIKRAQAAFDEAVENNEHEMVLRARKQRLLMIEDVWSERQTAFERNQRNPF